MCAFRKAFIAEQLAGSAHQLLVEGGCKGCATGKASCRDPSKELGATNAVGPICDSNRGNIVLGNGISVPEVDTCTRNQQSVKNCFKGTFQGIIIQGALDVGGGVAGQRHDVPESRAIFSFCFNCERTWSTSKPDFGCGPCIATAAQFRMLRLRPSQTLCD